MIRNETGVILTCSLLLDKKKVIIWSAKINAHFEKKKWVGFLLITSHGHLERVDSSHFFYVGYF